VDTKVLEKYIGNYELMPGFVFTVSVKNGKLFGVATGQRELELKAISETEFEVKDVGANFTFQMGPNGKCESLILLQGGQRLEGKRTK
jgi:hypothetical protein